MFFQFCSGIHMQYHDCGNSYFLVQEPTWWLVVSMVFNKAVEPVHWTPTAHLVIKIIVDSGVNDWMNF